MRTEMETIGTSALAPLTGDELHEVSGGDGPPGYWWLVTLFLAESDDIIEGFKQGFNAT
jgi:hypothetical protein